MDKPVCWLGDVIYVQHPNGRWEPAQPDVVMETNESATFMRWDDAKQDWLPVKLQEGIYYA